MIDGALHRREFSFCALSRNCVQLGYDVLTAFEDGRANQAITDRELLARATRNRSAHCLRSNRLDFKRLHKQMPDHAGIIICTEDPDRVGQAQRYCLVFYLSKRPNLSRTADLVFIVHLMK